MKIFFKFLCFNLLFTAALTAQQEEVGIASYYSDKFHGKPTASGELYNKNAMTGAHKTLAFGTIVKVTRLDNGKSVRVKINDRGPFISGRIVEVSRVAAEKIGLVNSGVAEVRLDIVKELTEEPVVEKTPPPKAPEKTEESTVAKTTKAPEKKAAPQETVAKSGTKAPEKKEKPAAVVKETPKTAVAEKNSAVSRMALVKGAEYQPFGLYSVQLRKPERAGYGVQVASLGSIDNAFRKIAELQGQWFDNILINMEKGEEETKVYKIILGPFADEAAANAYKASLKKKKIEGFVVSLAEGEPATE